MFSGIIGNWAKKGLRRGYQDGSTGWSILGVVLTGISVLRWLRARHVGEERLAVEELLPGESIIVRALRPGE
jgi:hypothetical protein